MVRTLILVRHGKSEDRTADDTEDEARRLTEAGRRSMVATFPATFSLLDTSQNLEIWTSPARRARQTASIVRHVLGTGEIEEHGSLYEQDVETIIAEVEASSCDTVVAVGHNPSMAQLLTQLTDTTLAFGKGAVAAITLGDNPREDAELSWFVQGPKSANWKVLIHMENIVAGNTVEMLECTRAFLVAPDDAETLHRMRIAIRSLRSSVMFIQPYQKRSQQKILCRDLRNLERATSKLREYDVLEEQIEELQKQEATEGQVPAPCGSDVDGQQESNPPEESSDAESAVKTLCQKMRVIERDRLLSILHGKKAQGALDRIVDEVKDIRWKRSIESKGLAESDVRRRFRGLLDQIESRLAKTDFDDAEATHELRKKAKQLRYVATDFAPLLEDDSTAVSSDMKRIQDDLGTLCDARVNNIIITSFGAHDLPEEAQGELAALKARQDEAINATLRALKG